MINDICLKVIYFFANDFHIVINFIIEIIRQYFILSFACKYIMKIIFIIKIEKIIYIYI